MTARRTKTAQLERWTRLGRELCDVMQMLESTAKLVNHNKNAELVMETSHATMKTASHLLRHVLEEANSEQLYWTFEAKE